MSPVRRMLVIPVVAFVALVGIAISATPAQAAPPDPPCEWEPGHWGTDSGCDGLHPLGLDHYAYCWDGEEVDLVPVGPAGNTLAYIALDYYYGGGACRTISAAILVVNPAASCYAKVERNYGSKLAYRVSGSYNDGWQVSRVVYDAGVTSYAWGQCTFNGSAYSARTQNY